MRRQSYNLFVIAAITMVFAACGKENGLEQTYQDRSLSFELSMASASHDTDESGASTKSMEIKSADGSITLPLEYRVTDGIGDISLAGESQTKGTQYNLLSELQTIGTFQVTAWNSDGSRFIPTPEDELEEGTINYTDLRWTLDGTAPLWKDADVKTFFAYTNLPEGASVTCESEASHTFSYTSLQTDAAAQKDALLGYYQGDGDRDGDGKPDGVAKIQFIHPLTAVVFVQGEFERVTAIKNLSIEGVYDGGKAVVTYSYNSDGSLVPSFDWGTSRSGKTNVTQTVPNSGALPGQDKQIGEPFILIPQDLTANEVTIKAVVTVDGSSDRTVQTKLSTGNWKEGMTNIYTLGYDANKYSYEFSLSDGKISGTQTFINTTSAETATVHITSTKTIEGGSPQAGDWLIKSVKVGLGPEEPVNATSFTDKGGINAQQTESGINSHLSITAAKRTPVDPSTRDYWIGDNGNWSPADWSTTKATASSPLDLSKFNFQDETTDNPMTTANCYIIRHAGTYKLPLVYGNAVVNGGDNKQSYQPDDTGGSQRLEIFVNSAGAGIESPFIENAEGCGGENLKCAVIWQDKAQVVKSLSIVDGASAGTVGSYDATNVRYLQFTVDNSTICQNNALICVYKDANGNDSYDSGEAVWSWHIWTTNDPALLSDPISVWTSNEPPYVEYKFFPLNNLGWIDVNGYPSREDVTIVLAQKKSGKEITITVRQNAVSGKSSGCFYQWGRKDPMLAKADVMKYEAGTVPISTAIKNPETFYYKNSDNWCSTIYFNLWTGKQSEAGNEVHQNPNMIKTIYDPSPVGYKMPAPKAFSVFKYDYTSGNFNLYFGHNFDTAKTNIPGNTSIVFFSAAGYLSSVNGSHSSSGTMGLYWSAMPRNNTNAYDFDFESNKANPSGNNPLAMGISVRPVKE